MDVNDYKVNELKMYFKGLKADVRGCKLDVRGRKADVIQLKLDNIHSSFSIRLDVQDKFLEAYGRKIDGQLQPRRVVVEQDFFRDMMVRFLSCKFM
jgi:hypothetical protein